MAFGGRGLLGRCDQALSELKSCGDLEKSGLACSMPTLVACQCDRVVLVSVSKRWQEMRTLRENVNDKECDDEPTGAPAIQKLSTQ
jgi:hypothetical protein